MTICKKVKIARSQLCSGDLDSYIGIYFRELGTSSYDENAEIDFTLVKNVWSAIETPHPIMRFNGINTNIREGIVRELTHIFYIYYDRDLLQTFSAKPILETGNYYIKYNKNPNMTTGWPDEVFRIIAVTNDNENNLFLKVFTSNRGNDDKKASHG